MRHQEQRFRPQDGSVRVKLAWGRKMNEIKTESKESSNHVLFPMAVGVLFLAVLVAGALLG
jgi:hypothetical protein